MTLKEIKNYIRETIYKRDRDYANVIYYLIKNGFSGKALKQIEEGDKIKGTTAENYNARIQDANKILTFNGFKSIYQAKGYMMAYSDLKDEEIEIIEKEEEK